MFYRSILPLAASIIVASSASAQVSVLSENFSKGLPDKFKTVCRDGAQISSAYFAQTLIPQQTWYWSGNGGIPDENFAYSEPGVTNDSGEPVGKRIGLLSCSRRIGEGATDNWLITPQIKVENGSSLRWLARSIHYHLRENYKVMVSTTDNDPSSFSEIYNVENEAYFWKNRYVDLSPYTGKNIYIAFVHCSENKFLLGIDDIEIGIASEPVLRAVNTGMHYFGADDSPVVEAMIGNYGAPAEIKSYKVLLGEDNEIIGLLDNVGARLDGGESVAVSIPVAIDVDKAGKYRLVAVCSDDTEITLMEDFINRSTYRRKMFVQKFTGTWCNSCPKVGYSTHIILEHLGKEAVYAESHHSGSGGGDADGYLDYIRPIPLTVTGDYPALWFNQRYQKESYRPKDFTAYEKAALMPCKAEVRLEAFKANENHLAATASVTFSENIDNSDDHLKIGFIVVDKETAPAEKSTLQEWQLPGIECSYGEYYFMPSKISKELNTLENVVRAPADGATGIAGSLPANIEAGESYTVYYEFEYTPNISTDNVALIANIVDGNSRYLEVLNSDIRDVESPAADAEFTLSANYAELMNGKELSLTAMYRGAPCSDALWTSSNPEVAEVSNGLVLAKSDGMAQIVATHPNGGKASCLVTVDGTTGIESTLNETSDLVPEITDNILSLSFADCEYNVAAYAVDGRKIAAKVGKGTNVRLDIGSNGVIIVKINRNGKTETFKIIGK